MTENTTLPSDTNIAIVQNIYAAVGGGDIEKVLDAVSDDVEWAAEAASGSAPWYGDHRGKDGVARFLQAIVSTVEIDEFTPHSFCTNATDVMNLVVFRYRVRATGRSASMSMHHHWKLRDGKVIHFRGSEDTEQTASCLGGVPLAKRRV